MLNRDEMRAYMATRRAEWKEQGKCYLCGYDREDLQYKTCGKCRELARKRTKRQKEKLKCERSAAL